MTILSQIADDSSAIPCSEPNECLPESGLKPLTRSESDKVERLIRQHRPLLKRLCRGQMNQREDAEDLEALCVMSICRRFGSYDPGRGAFGTWLGTIVRNEASDWRRRVSRQPVCLPSDENTEAVIEHAVAKAYEPSDVPELPELSRLPELLRQAFVLVKLGGLSSAEAAQAMGTTDGTVRTYVWKARKLLRACCFASGPDDNAETLEEILEDKHERIGMGGEGRDSKGSRNGWQQPFPAHRCA